MRARSEADVVGVMQDYLATLLPSDLASLPPQGRVLMITSGDGVIEAAVVLAGVSAKTMSGAPEFELLNQLAGAFATAHERIRQIRSRERLISP